MRRRNYLLILMSLCGMFLLQNYCYGQTQDCRSCHTNEANLWSASKHANTQTDVASELSSDWIGQTPDSVINGSQAEDCISCHSPVSVNANGGMTETQAMGYFYSTTDGKYTDSTKAVNTANWEGVVCETCHQSDMKTFGVFNSKTKSYDAVKTANDLCGNCHGTVKYADTDHRVYDAWLSSKHGHGGQADVAGELADEHSGQTAAEVTADEDCIACHAPTAVTLDDGLTEAQALGKFFTASGGTFSSSTVPADTVDFPNVSCVTCHNPHKPGALSYFNSSTKSYEVMSSSDSLCGQCHGNLRFADTDHLSYNILSGTGGMNVSDMTSMNGIHCIDCHMYNTDVDGSNSAMFKGHTWSVFVKEPDGSVDASCTNCHSGLSADSSQTLIAQWESDFQVKDSIAEAKVAEAANNLKTSQDSNYFKEAKFNMTYAESDESGGVHNHAYSIALLNDAINKAAQLVTGIKEIDSNAQLILSQNYPNPFKSVTTINYTLPAALNVRLEVFNTDGKKVATLIDSYKQPGTYSVMWNADGFKSGMYFYKITAGKHNEVKRLMLLK